MMVLVYSTGGSFCCCSGGRSVCCCTDGTGCSAKVASLNFSQLQIVEKITEFQSGPPRFVGSIKIWDFPNFVVADKKKVQLGSLQFWHQGPGTVFYSLFEDKEKDQG